MNTIIITIFKWICEPGFLFTLHPFIHSIIAVAVAVVVVVVVVVVGFFSPPKPFICSSLFYRNRWTFSNALQSTTTIRSTGTWIGRNINGPTTFTMHKTMVALWNIHTTHSHTYTHPGNAHILIHINKTKSSSSVG